MRLLKRLLGVEDGWGGAIGLLMLLGFGLVFVGIGAANLGEASQRAPVELTCDELVATPRPPKWVRVVKCRPEGHVLAPGLVLEGAAPEGDTFTGMLEAGGPSLVLHHGRAPERLKLLTPLFVGLVAVALAVRTRFRRWLVERDASL